MSCRARFLPALALAALAGCDSSEPSTPALPTPNDRIQSVARALDERDARVWPDEVEARRHEAALTDWMDRFRNAEQPYPILASLPFEALELPQPMDPTESLDASVRRQRFAYPPSLRLTRADWTAALETFRRAGGRIAHVELNHEAFLPPTAPDQPARSVVDFEWHGDQTAASNRFILRGTALVQWTNAPAGPAPMLWSITNLLLLERSGPAAFSAHALVAPEPDRAGGSVNVHPLVVADVNADGHDDVALPGVNAVLLNDGQANLTRANLIDPIHFDSLKETGVLADFDGDGRPDYLTVADRGARADLLVLFPGGLAPPWAAPPRAAWPAQRDAFDARRWSNPSAIAAGDIDGDGDLDVFVAHYRPPYVRGNLPTPYYDANDGEESVLLLNDGSGTFHRAAPQPALQAKARRRTLAAAFVDLDEDGDLDLVSQNDFSGTDLFLNDGRGGFTDATGLIAYRQLFGMGQTFADFDRDGRLDLLAVGMDSVTVRRLERLGEMPAEFPDRTRARAAMTFGNRLLCRRENGWRQPPWAAGLARTGWSWGSAAFDLDLDGDLELYVANGHVSGASCANYDSYYWTRDIYLGGSDEDSVLQAYFDDALGGLNRGATSWNGYQHNALWLDVGDHEYVNVAHLMGVAHETDCRAVVSADLNEDGRPDLLVTEAIWQGRPDIMHHRLLIHLNRIETVHHWIGVKLDLTDAGERGSPFGARVRLRSPAGERVAQAVAGDSFQSQPPATILFGLGADPRVDSLEILWPNGRAALLQKPAANRYHGNHARLPD